MEIALWIVGGVFVAVVLAFVLILLAIWIFLSNNPWL